MLLIEHIILYFDVSFPLSQVNFDIVYCTDFQLMRTVIARGVILKLSFSDLLRAMRTVIVTLVLRWADVRG